jgi:hypothetical protein
MRILVDTIVSCFAGYNQCFPEWYAKGYGKYLLMDSTYHVIGLKPECNTLSLPIKVGITDPEDPLYVDPFDQPALVVLRLEESVMNKLVAEDWQNSRVLASCRVGGEQVNVGTEEEPEWQQGTLRSRLMGNADSLAEYLSYPEVQVPEFNADGSVNIQFHEFLEVLVDGVPTLVKNPHHQPFLGLGSFS